MEKTPVCMDCGACCASFRVSFYWGECDDAPGGWVPSALTEQLTPYLRAMKGSNCASPRCEQLQGEVPGALCRIYPQRPSTCHDMQPYLDDGTVNPQCSRARAKHGLEALQAVKRTDNSAD